MAERRKKPFWIKGTYFDYPTLFYIIFLTFFGLMMVYSSSVYISNRYYDNGYKYLTKQFGFAMVGFLIMFLVSRVRYQVFKKFIYLFIIALVLMLLYVLIWGKEVNGASRWISLGPISFQPSEIAKIVVPLYMGYACTDRTWFMYSLKGMAALFGPVLVIVGLIAVENLSTAIIVGAMAFGVWFMATTKHIYIIHMAVLGALALVALILAEPYRIKRITNWGGKEDAYQTIQGLYAVGTGGLFGRGLGQSVQKMGKIPEAQNDMIFSVICEELGIVGAVGLIIVFIMLIWRLKFIAEGAPDRFGSLVVVGILIHIGFQVLVNMSVVTNVIPNTGVTLPFISYGGSSLLFLFAEMGLVLGISRQIVPLSKEEESDEQ